MYRNQMNLSLGVCTSSDYTIIFQFYYEMDVRKVIDGGLGVLSIQCLEFLRKLIDDI